MFQTRLKWVARFPPSPPGFFGGAAKKLEAPGGAVEGMLVPETPGWSSGPTDGKKHWQFMGYSPTISQNRYLIDDNYGLINLINGILVAFFNGMLLANQLSTIHKCWWEYELSLVIGRLVGEYPGLGIVIMVIWLVSLLRILGQLLGISW